MASGLGRPNDEDAPTDRKSASSPVRAIHSFDGAAICKP